MADDASVEAPWKRFVGRPQSEASKQRKLERRAFREDLLDSFDRLGRVQYLIKMGNGTQGDRAAYMALLGKLLPLEVAGSLDASLTVNVVTMLGESHRIDLSRPQPMAPRITVQAPEIPVSPRSGPDPAGPPDGDDG